MKRKAGTRPAHVETIPNPQIYTYLMSSYADQVRHCQKDLLDLEVMRKRTIADITALRAQIAKLRKAHPTRLSLTPRKKRCTS